MTDFVINNITANMLFEMEQVLAEPQFAGVPIGSTLGDVFLINLLHKHHDLSLKNTVRDLLGCFKYFISGDTRRTVDVGRMQSKILFTWIHDKQSLRNMVLPLVKAMGPDNCVVFGSNPAMREKLPPGAMFLAWDDVSRINAGQWRYEFLLCLRRWLPVMVKVCRQHGVTSLIIPLLVKYLIINSRRSLTCGYLLDQLQPRMVVTEYDRNTLASCLVLAARARGILTSTLTHGTINPPYGYTPVLADKIFCWGEHQRRQLVEMGTSPEKVLPAGAPHIFKSIGVDGLSVRARIGIDLFLPLVMLATSPIKDSDRSTLAKTFCDALSKTKQVGVVRLHPSEKLEFYANLAQAYPGVRFMANEELTLDEAMAISDVVCCHDSSFGHEAVIKGKPVVVLDVLTTPLRGGVELVESAGCPKVSNSQALAAELHQLEYDEEYRKNLLERQERHVKDNYTAFGSEAIDNIVASLRVGCMWNYRSMEVQ